MSYLKINFDDSMPALEEIELPEELSAFVSACHIVIGCDCIELAATFFRDLVLIIDESAKLRDEWWLRINVTATCLYRYNSPMDPIVGDAILACMRGEDLIPLNDRQIELVKRFV